MLPREAHKFQSLFVAFCGLVPLISAPAAAQVTWGCLEPALKTELERKLAFQEELATLAKEEQPDFVDVAALSAATSTAQFEMRYARIVWLWQTDQNRFASADAFWSFPWSDEDNETWLSSDPKHEELSERVDALQQRTTEHPDIDAYREFMFQNRASEPFLQAAITFGEAIKADRERVAACY